MTKRREAKQTMEARKRAYFVQMNALSKENRLCDLTREELQARMDAIWHDCFVEPDHPSVVCPRCGRRSYNPGDITHRYCGACHRYHDDLKGESRMITRAEHLSNTKTRANALVDSGDLDGAVSAMIGGLREHAETAMPAPMEDARMLEISDASTRSPDRVREWTASFT